MNPPAMGYCDSEEEDSKDSSSWRGRQVFPDKIAALQWFEYSHDTERMEAEFQREVLMELITKKRTLFIIYNEEDRMDCWEVEVD
jgi:hypothetical protein